MPSGSLFIILIIVAGVWQLIQVIAESAAKKKAIEEAERRRQEAHLRTGPGSMGSTGDGSAPGAPSVPASSRAEELAARRRAQLDDLRRRAAQKRAKGGLGAPTVGPGSGASTSVRTGSVSTPTGMATPPPAPPPTRRAPTMADDIAEAKQRQRELEARRAAARRQQAEAEEARRAARKTARRAAEQKAAQQKARSSKSDAAARRAASTGPEAGGAGRRAGTSPSRTAPAVPAGPSLPVGGPPSDRLRARLQDPRTIRDLLVLKELLDQPLSVRAAAEQPGARVGTLPL